MKINIYYIFTCQSERGQQPNGENGNFFAGLEATQTGDLDRSFGRNNFIIMNNPGFAKYVLQQDGIGNNIYNLGNKIGTGSTVKIINNFCSLSFIEKVFSIPYKQR